MARKPKTSDLQPAFDFGTPMIDLRAVESAKDTSSGDVVDVPMDEIDEVMSADAVLSPPASDAAEQPDLADVDLAAANLAAANLADSAASVEPGASREEPRTEGGVGYRYFEVDLHAAPMGIAATIADHFREWDNAGAMLHAFVERHGLIDGYGSLMDIQGFVADEVKPGWRQSGTCLDKPVVVPDRTSAAGKAIAAEIDAFPIPQPMDEFTADLHKHIKMPRRNGHVAGLRRSKGAPGGAPGNSAGIVWLALPSVAADWTPPEGIREVASADFVRAA